MAYTPTTFVDRSVQYPGRRVLTPVSGQANTVDVTRAEGTVFDVGTEIDADNLNAEFAKIKNEFDVINALPQLKKVSATTPSTTGSDVKIVTDNTLYNNYVVIGYSTYESSVSAYINWNITAISTISIKSDGIYCTLQSGAGITSKPIYILLMKIS